MGLDSKIGIGLEETAGEFEVVATELEANITALEAAGPE